MERLCWYNCSWFEACWQKGRSLLVFSEKWYFQMRRISCHIETWQNNRLTKHRSLFSSIMDLKKDMSWKSWFYILGVFQVILKRNKTIDWWNTDHCFLISWIWLGRCPGNHGSEKGHVLEIMDLKRDMSILCAPIDVPVIWEAMIRHLRSRPPQITNQCLLILDHVHM